MTRLDDTALLDALGAALAPSAVAPDPEEVAAVRALTSGIRDENVVLFAARPQAVRRPLRHALAVAAAIVALVVVGSVVALATGSSVPSELRAPARALGLPVDSTAVADTRTAMARLRVALAQPDDVRVLAARDALVAVLRRLGTEDRAAVEPEAQALLARADARLRPTEIGDTAGASRPGGATTRAPTGETTVPGVAEPEAPGIVGPTAVVPTPGAEPEGPTPSTTVTTEPGDDGTEAPDD
jgi:hypothetical protein